MLCIVCSVAWSTNCDYFCDARRALTVKTYLNSVVRWLANFQRLTISSGYVVIAKWENCFLTDKLYSSEPIFLFDTSR